MGLLFLISHCAGVAFCGVFFFDFPFLGGADCEAKSASKVSFSHVMRVQVCRTHGFVLLSELHATYVLIY